MQVAEKRVRHVRVVVLSGMDHERLKLFGPRLHRSHDRRNLHEVGPRPNDIDYFDHGTVYRRITRALLALLISPFKAFRVSTISGASEQTRL